MSFDRPNQSPHRSALSPEDHRPGLQQQQQQQQQQDFQQSSGYHTSIDSFASSPERWDSYNNRRPSSSSHNAPSLYSNDPPYAHQTSPLGYSHQHDSATNSWTEGSPDRNHTLTSFTPDRNSLQQQPGQTSPSTSTSSYPPYDPIRNNISNEEMSPTGNGRYLEHSKASSPAMSISQLLSDSAAPPYAPPPPSSSSSSIPFTATTTLSNSPQPGPEGQPYFKSINPSHQQPLLSTTSVSRNGIGNLLNMDTKEKPTSTTNNVSDSDTDSEDIALITDHDHHPTATMIQPENVYIGNGNASTPTTEGLYNNDKSGAGHRQSVPLEEEEDASDISLVDDLSDNDGGIPTALLNWKSSKYNIHRRDLDHLSDDDNDDNDDNQGEDTDDDKELLEVHKHAMVEYMLNIHRRKKAAIDAYEFKRTRRQKKMKEHLEQVYEKRYGNDMWKLRGGLEIPSALLHKVKQEKDRFKERRHHGLHRILKKGRKKLSQYHDHHHHRHSDMEDYGSADSSDVDDTLGELDFLDPVKAKTISQNKMDAERKRIWLDIARTDIPRMARIITRVQATRAGNCKKLAQYCQKEAKRVATKGGRATKDIQLKAKRAQKEMLIFWKKNEKEERELRKKAEREALERLRQEEERREAQRQARKLNFLITQTELYSHFIGRKINKDVTEDDDTAPQADENEPTPSQDGNNDESVDIDITAHNDDQMGEVDFDDDDEDKLKEHARKSAQNALAKQREQTKAFDEGAKQRRMDANGSSDVNMQDQLDTMNFQEPSSMGSGPEVKQPSILMCQLKSYQLKGLNWLVNLYEQGINGILADEMGLGKTVQSISLMAYLAEVHNIWGPFLVIAPASTLHNWQQEISKFVPSFRALPYWGNPKERKILRQSWTRKQLYGRDAPFHIVITSYQLVLTDVNYFQRVKWQYMVLDEAQAIKSSSSARWKLLLGFYCRNRLLLTGTPIQNSMQELWALLHFIMPTLFDSHEEFSEWFSKDIESHAENKGTLNEHQLRRLHMILKPFMLRRIKKNVQHELGEKIEVEVYCDLTARQKQLYRGLKEKISISELLEKATSLSDLESMDSLMNLVMQFRKVCNHPELFERADVESPYAFCDFGESGPLSKEQVLEYSYSTKNKIKYHLPKQVYRNGGLLKVPGSHSNAGFSTRYLDNLMNIWDGGYIQKSMESSENDAAFSFLRFIDTSAQEASYLFKHSLISRWLFHLSRRDQRARRRFYKGGEDDIYADTPLNTYARLLIADTETQTDPLMVTSGSPMDELIHIGDKLLPMVKRFDNNYFPGARSVPVDVICSDISFEMEQQSQLFNPNVISALLGTPQYMNKREPEQISTLKQVVRKSGGQGIMTVPSSGYGYSQMKVPAMRDLILDSGKLAKLDKLLERLKNDGHRCLIYFQMTRMIDLMEEYIAYKQYKYLRLDGSSKISDRRDMVQDWQTRPEIFIFLLSTRAGGLGINLTAADTVIFYDSDWNPTVDQQAMDRAHRLGQTKQVTVYRLLTKGTIEERILMRAKQKDEIQKVVISGGEFKQVDFKPREIVSLLLDDEELDNKLAQQLKRKAIEEENKKNKNGAKEQSRPAKRSRKQGSKESTPAQSPFTVDQLFSAGGDTLPEDESEPGASSKSKLSSSSSSSAAGSAGSAAAAADKKSRTGRPRTNFSFTG